MQALAIIIMLVFFQKLGVVFGALKKFWDIVFPFVFGASLAFIVNVPMNQIENKFLGRKPFKGKRILAWFITIVLILAVIAGAMFIIVPQIVDTAKSVAANVQNLGSLSDIQAWIIQKVPQTESLIVSPKLALIFMGMFLVLQQIEGKLIYPHVVGSTVGLPGIWVLFAITVGGELLGVAGMLIFVPLCSVLYALFREFVYHRLAERQVTPDKWALNPPEAARGEPIKVNTEKLQKLKERKAKAKAAADEAQESIADVIEDGRDTPEE